MSKQQINEQHPKTPHKPTPANVPSLSHNDLLGVVKQAARDVLGISSADKVVTMNSKGTIVEGVKSTMKKVLTEMTTFIMPKVFMLKTAYLSSKTKEIHFSLYDNYVKSFNAVVTKLGGVLPSDADNPSNSQFKSLKLDEQHNLNGVKLHELYFCNIGNPSAKLSMDSIPYIRLARDFGDFDKWQFDFRGCGMAGEEEGWAICYYDPYLKCFKNTFIQKHSCNVPVMGIPVLVVDVWAHAWFKDYPGDKKTYLNAMMNEINWVVVEQRMNVVEHAGLAQIFSFTPVADDRANTVLDAARMPTNQPPITPEKGSTTVVVQQQMPNGNAPDNGMG